VQKVKVWIAAHLYADGMIRLCPGVKHGNAASLRPFKAFVCGCRTSADPIVLAGIVNVTRQKATPIKFRTIDRRPA
jgi:hypothetical protein